MMRARNLWHIVGGVACLPVVVPVILVLIPVTLVEEIDWLNDLWGRTQRQLDLVRRWVTARRRGTAKNSVT